MQVVLGSQTVLICLREIIYLYYMPMASNIDYL